MRKEKYPPSTNECLTAFPAHHISTSMPKQASHVGVNAQAVRKRIGAVCLKK